MGKALVELYQLGALDNTGHINGVGRAIAQMPLSPRLGRVLTAAIETDCLAEMIDIVSCLSVENIFLGIPLGEETARLSLYRREGDHLTFLKIVRAYMEENTDRKAWAEKFYISHRAMQAVMVSKNLSNQPREEHTDLILASTEAIA